MPGMLINGVVGLRTNLEFSSFGDVLDAFEWFVFLGGKNTARKGVSGERHEHSKHPVKKSLLF